MNVETAGPVELQPFADMPETGPNVVGEIDGNPHLIGSECTECRARFFPRRSICFNCMGVSLADVALASEGSLYSVTTVHVSASRETPYTIGFVDLNDGVRVLAPITGYPLPELDTGVRLEADNGQWWFSAVPRAGKK
ncbi:MAG: catD5 [Microbacteriaceae bacterium]|jgi:uncharacterized OB-fold protein|nr:catD5 [Microbacteriaceae bacterium]